MQQLTTNKSLQIWTPCDTLTAWQSWKSSHSLSDKFSYDYDDNINNNDYVTQSNQIIHGW